MRTRRSFIATAGALFVFSGCAWGQLGGNASRTGYADAETSITTANVSQLALRWSVPAGGFAGAYMANGLLYSLDWASTPQRVVAFSADGSRGCGGTPRTCQPLWSAPIKGQLYPTEFSGAAVIGTPYGPTAVAIAGNDLFVTSRGTNFVYLEAFDALGVKNCAGAPAVCAPRWSGAVSGTGSDLAVADGIVYLGTNINPSASQLAAFAVDGSTCGSSVQQCQPRWSVATPPGGRLAIGDGHIVFGSLILNLDASAGCGQQQCAYTGGLLANGRAALRDGWAHTRAGSYRLGSGVSCPMDEQRGYRACPLDWVREPGASSLPQAPNVSGDHVIMAETLNGGFAPEARVRVFDVDGGTTCSGVPKVCAPLADLITGGSTEGVTATPNLIFVAAGSGYNVVNVGTLFAFDANLEQGCSGTPKRCAPLWWSRTDQANLAPPTIANGLIGVSSASGGIRVYGLPN